MRFSFASSLGTRYASLMKSHLPSWSRWLFSSWRLCHSAQVPSRLLAELHLPPAHLLPAILAHPQAVWVHLTSSSICRHRTLHKNLLVTSQLQAGFGGGYLLMLKKQRSQMRHSPRLTTLGKYIWGHFAFPCRKSESEVMQK